MVKSCYTAFAMDVKSNETLELNLVLQHLASCTAFSASREKALALQPLTELEAVRRRQAETSEACLLLSIQPDVSIGGARDVRAQVDAAAHGAVLEAADLLDVKSMLIAARDQRRRFDKLDESFSLLKAIASSLEALPGLIDSISKTIDDRGEVLDGASQKLSTIRKDLRVAHDRLMGKLERMINNPKTAQLLQEPIITQREGRFVIPLQADFKGRIEAVVHDQSASGATLFVEPLQVVDLNNQVRELQLAERDEIRRILAELSLQIGEQTEAIHRNVEGLAGLDLAFAKARYARSIDASEPILKPVEEGTVPNHPGSTMRLIDARHPLLNTEDVVPIDLILKKDTYALVITGPNTGGKTVTLKTAGLLVLMTQCGLHIPAVSGSELSIFDAVYADIGDEQSIEQSLSTFSSHVSNIKTILDRATSKSLVLLDELGAGTDPQEGAALARALLGELLARSITTLVATHYPELKTYAHSTPGVNNASMEFDLQSLSPTYHLHIGLPGRSNALAIAARLGLEETIIENARAMLSTADLEAEQLLDEIHTQRELTRKDRSEAEAKRQQAFAMEEELSGRLKSIDKERDEILLTAQQKADLELENLRTELRKIKQEFSRTRRTKEALKDAEKEIETLTKSISDSLQVDDEEKPVHVYKEGDAVFLRTIAAEGVIQSLDQDHAEVQVGRLRVRAALNELLPAGEGSSPKRKKGTRKGGASRDRQPISTPIIDSPPLELHIRGWTIEDALEALDRRLDAAFLAGMPYLRVVHGKGTGRLRRAVRQALQSSPYVASFESGQPAEGGEGVTVVRLNVA